MNKEEIEDEDNEDKDDEEKEYPRTTYYVYDNEDIILEYNHKGKVTAKYIHGPGIDEPLAVEKKKGIYYYHADGLGSITALTDSKGKVVQRYDYDSFGNLKTHGNKVKQPYTYTGREWDREIGFYYYRARYYDPKIGRFLSFDPILHPANVTSKVESCSQSSSHPRFDELMKKPQKLNPYLYTEGNPINLTDPTGLSSCGSGWNAPYVPDNYGLWSFAGPCENHDKCYGTCGSSRIWCDLMFYSDMMMECSKLWNLPVNQASCIETSMIYFAVVRVAGKTPFDNAQKAACCK